jgi:hypothetical protein
LTLPSYEARFCNVGDECDSFGVLNVINGSVIELASISVNIYSFKISNLQRWGEGGMIAKLI